MDITYWKHANGYTIGQPGYVEPTQVTVKGRITPKPDEPGYYRITSPTFNPLGWTRIHWTNLITPDQIIGKGIC